MWKPDNDLQALWWDDKRNMITVQNMCELWSKLFNSNLIFLSNLIFYILAKHGHRIFALLFTSGFIVEEKWFPVRAWWEHEILSLRDVYWL